MSCDQLSLDLQFLALRHLRAQVLVWNTKVAGITALVIILFINLTETRGLWHVTKGGGRNLEGLQSEVSHAL